MTDSEALDTNEPEPDKHKVIFWPPLFEQRQAWVLEELRKNNVRTVVDVGCGEGALLACLCNPPGSLPDYGPVPSRAETPSPSERLSKSAGVLEGQGSQVEDLHLIQIQGLDVGLNETKQSNEITRPSETFNPYELPRWDDLEVHIWQGSLHVWNDSFVGVDCIVATEVVEHLEHDILPYFTQTLLGAYRPRLFLITTPSFDFNPLFTPPGQVDPEGILDPTGRTQRVFRHWDHKFEWTREEFRQYCEKEAQRWGYDVQIGGVGVSLEADPWGREQELGKASQVAAFRRKEDWVVLSLEERRALAGKGEGHQLMARHVHRGHPQAHQPRKLDEIAQYIESVTKDGYFDDGTTLWGLWVTEDVAPLCGGHMDILIQALEICPNIIVDKDESVSRYSWKITFCGRTTSKPEGVSEKAAEGLVFQGRSSVTYGVDWHDAAVFPGGSSNENTWGASSDDGWPKISEDDVTGVKPQGTWFESDKSNW